MIAAVPVGIAHELADEAPGHPAASCVECGTLARPLFDRCERCQILARTIGGRILLALHSGPRSRAWLCRRLGKSSSHLGSEMRLLRDKRLIAFDPSRGEWRAL